jgi:hypothetical protein
VAGKMDWDGHNRRVKAGKPFYPARPRAPMTEFTRAYIAYAEGERLFGRRPLSRKDWKDRVFAILREGH